MTQPPADLVRLVKAVDAQGIESARSRVKPADVPLLTAWYSELETWDQKLALVDLICDQNHPSMEAVLIDALRAPGAGDWIDLPKAFALGWLSDDLDQFMTYYNDRDLLRRTVDAFLAERGLAREPDPLPEPKPLPPLPDEPTTRFIMAVRDGHNDEVGRMLAAGTSPDTVHGDPALCVALIYKNFDAAMMLVQAGADPNTRRSTANQPALWWAASMGAVDIVDALIRAGARVDAEDDWGSTPLTVASSSGHVDVVKRLLEAGANVHNQISDKRTVLNLAVRGGKAQILKLLVEAGADLHSRQPNFTPLGFACFEGTAAMVKVLLDLGADPNARFTAIGSENGTALMVAARSSKTKMVQHLLSAGAKPGLKDRNGKTAADHAKGRRAEAIRALLTAG